VSKSKIVKCIDCDREFPRKELNRMGRCPECAMAAMRDDITQMHAHSGPYYEKWKQAVKAAAGKL